MKSSVIVKVYNDQICQERHEEDQGETYIARVEVAVGVAHREVSETASLGTGATGDSESVGVGSKSSDECEGELHCGKGG